MYALQFNPQKFLPTTQHADVAVSSVGHSVAPTVYVKIRYGSNGDASVVYRRTLSFHPKLVPHRRLLLQLSRHLSSVSTLFASTW